MYQIKNETERLNSLRDNLKISAAAAQRLLLSDVALELLEEVAGRFRKNRRASANVNKQGWQLADAWRDGHFGSAKSINSQGVKIPRPAAKREILAQIVAALETLRVDAPTKADAARITVAIDYLKGLTITDAGDLQR